MTPRAMRLGILVCAIWFCTASAFAQTRHKGANFGGIPKKLLDAISGDVTGTPAAGVTPDQAVHVLFALVQEEHAAANPGPDETGFMDAYIALDEVRTAVANLHENSNTANTTVLVGVLIKKIEAVGKLWKVGPVAPGFYSPEEP